MSAAAIDRVRSRIQAVMDEVGRVVVGKDDVVRLVISALLARGHVLIEDVPGVGKTTLAKSLARAFGCSFNRIQFTADLAHGSPEDIEEQVVEALRAGVDIISPGCAISPLCPNANIKAMSTAIARWYESGNE